MLQMVNIFWILLILRILYRAVFSDVVKDERSDDETEVEEEVGEGKANGLANPSLMLNGESFSPVDGQAPATGMEVRGGEDVVKRKR
jgi:hypothetical protein